MTRTIAYRSFRSLAYVTAYPAAVLAATQEAFGDEFRSYSLYSFAVIGFCIFLGGFTGLLRRLKKEYDDNDELRHPKLFICSNVFGAIAGGVIVVFAGMLMKLGTGAQGLSIIAGSYAGVVLVEQTFDWMMTKIFRDAPASARRINLNRRTEDFDRKLYDQPNDGDK
jgi:hypothetical protein